MSGASLDDPVDDGRCFACGPYSEHGLRMRFEQVDGDSVECRTMLAQTFQGWRGVAHGGIVAMLLDEAMAHAAGVRGYLGVTADLRTRFRAAIPLGVPLVVSGAVQWQRRNVLGLRAQVAKEDGAILAYGEGTFVIKGRLEPGRRLGGFDAER